MGNILQKPTETVYIVVLLVYLSYISVSCSQTVDEEQGTQAPETCTSGYLFAGTSSTEGITLFSVLAYEDHDQASFTIENASLPLNTITLASLRVTKGQRSIDLIPQRGGVLLVPSIRDSPNNTESVFVRSPVDCVFTGFYDISDIIRDSVLGFCVGATYFNPLTIRVKFNNLSNSRILQNRREELYGIYSNFIYVSNRCLPDEYGHIVYMDDGYIVDFNIEPGTYLETTIQTCVGESRLELITPYKLAAYCDGGATLITICDIIYDNGDSSRYSTSFTRSEWGEVYFCSETVFVSAKNDTLTLHSVNDRQKIGYSTHLSSDEIKHAVCNVNDDVFHFVTTLENGETWYCNLSDSYCMLLGMSERAVDTASALVDGKYVIFNNDTHALLYDLSCQANPVVARLNQNFDIANFYPAPLHVPCQCSVPPTTAPPPVTTDLESTTDTPTTMDQSTTTESLETDSTEPPSSISTPSVGPPMESVPLTTAPPPVTTDLELTTDTPTTMDQSTTTESLETNNTTTEPPSSISTPSVAPPMESAMRQLDKIIVAVVVSVVVAVSSVVILVATLIICKRKLTQKRRHYYDVNGGTNHELQPLGTGNSTAGNTPEPAGNGEPQLPPLNSREEPQLSPLNDGETQLPSSNGGEPLLPPSNGGEPLSPPSNDGEPLLPPSNGGEPLSPPSNDGEPLLPPSNGGEPLLPPSNGGEPLLPPSNGGESQLLPLNSGEPLLPPSNGGESQLLPLNGGEPLLPPSNDGKPQLPPSNDGEPQLPPSNDGEPQLSSSNSGDPQWSPVIVESQQPSDSSGEGSLDDENVTNIECLPATTGHNNHPGTYTISTLPLPLEPSNSNVAVQYSMEHGGTGFVEQNVTPQNPVDCDPEHQSMVVSNSQFPSIHPIAILEHWEHTVQSRADTHIRVVIEHKNREPPDNDRNHPVHGL